MKKILLTGATGLVGSRTIELLKDDFEFIPLDRSVDITNRDHVHTALKKIEYDLFFHLAAYTNVDGAETEKETAYNINVNGTKNLLEATQEKGKEFVHISTDFVFDGQHSPYFEDSEPNPISEYGKTKYQAEQVVNGKGMIVRLSYPYRKEFEKKKDFMRVIKSLLEQGRELTMVTDLLMTPTFIDDFAYGLKYLFNNYSAEIFHLNGADAMSPYNCGKLIAQTFKLDESLVKPTTYDAYFAGKAKRPQYAEMKSRKNNFQKMKSFSEGLKYTFNT